MKEAIIVFTRVPLPGQTKTRLMPVYTPQECAALHTCFIEDILKECLATGKDIFLYYTPEGQETALRDALNFKGTLYLQEGETLGDKMFQGIRDTLGRGYASCILIGTDLPELKRHHLLRAFEVLKENDVVLGPTRDEGYYLIGMKKPIEEAFLNQTYGSGTVLKNTIDALTKANYRIACIDPISDIDVPVDLLHYYEMIGDKLDETITGNYLLSHPKISVIIPLYNEASTIEDLLKEIKKLEGCEIIFVDGGSTDDTLNYINSDYQVIHSSKGRGNQMNKGAEASSGNILFFLHCDSQLPKNPIEEIRQVMIDNRGGCFGIHFQPASPLLYLCQWASNFRAKRQKIIFGDQGLFIERGLFFEVGMFPSLPLMEDYQLSLTLKKKKASMGMTKKRLTTSSRRFQGNSFHKVKVMLKMKKLQRLYRKGTPIEEIVMAYRDIR